MWWGWQRSPNPFGTRNRFQERQFFHGWVGGGDGFGMIQVYYMYCALNFYCYSISSASDH